LLSTELSVRHALGADDPQPTKGLPLEFGEFALTQEKTLPRDPQPKLRVVQHRSRYQAVAVGALEFREGSIELKPGLLLNRASFDGMWPRYAVGFQAGLPLARHLARMDQSPLMGHPVAEGDVFRPPTRDSRVSVFRSENEKFT
jgi:hypothetical protein